MSSSGILSINSGPLIIRTYLDGSSNNSYVLGQYDMPVLNGLVLTTSTNGLLVPSNNINISSITVSTLSSNTISTGGLVAGYISSNIISTGQIFASNARISSLIVSSINGVVPISSGTYYSDYLFWNNTTNIWDIGSSTIHIGSFAGSTLQGSGSVSIGYYAGVSSQNTSSIAIGTNAGSFNQSTLCIAIGNNAGNTGQLSKAIAIGNSAGQINQSGSAIAIGDFTAQVSQGLGGIAIGTVAGTFNQSTNSIAIGTSAARFNQQDSAVALGNYAGNYYQSTNAIAIGTYAGSTSQGINAIAIGAYAGMLNQSSNTIILNASGVNVSSLLSSAFYVNPIRYDVSQTSTLNYNTITNEITYSSKTFVIQHPSKQDNYLVHACLEGPESGVYYRGTAIILGRFVEIELPEYVMAFADNFTVNVTHVFDEANDTECKLYSATRVKDGRFRIYGPCGTVDWVVFGKRADIEVEPLKSTVDVKGNGPYRWL